MKEKDTETAGNGAISWLLRCSSVAKNLAQNLCLIEITPLPSSSSFFFLSFFSKMKLQWVLFVKLQVHWDGEANPNNYPASADMLIESALLKKKKRRKLLAHGSNSWGCKWVKTLGEN